MPGCPYEQNRLCPAKPARITRTHPAGSWPRHQPASVFIIIVWPQHELQNRDWHHDPHGCHHQRPTDVVDAPATAQPPPGASPPCSGIRGGSHMVDNRQGKSGARMDDGNGKVGEEDGVWRV